MTPNAAPASPGLPEWVSTHAGNLARRTGIACAVYSNQAVHYFRRADLPTPDGFGWRLLGTFDGKTTH